MRRMFSEKQIERFAKRVIESGVDISNLFTNTIEDEEGILVVNNQGGIQALSSSEHTGEFLGVDEHGTPSWIDMEDVDLQVKSVSEEGDTALIDLSEYILAGFAKSNTFYAKLLVKHGMLHIVISGKFVAGGSAGTNIQIMGNFASAIPEAIRSKIYRADGTNLTQAPSSTNFADNFVCGSMCTKRIGTTISSSVCILQSQGANNLLVTGFSFGTIAENTECIFDLRFALTI